MNRNLMLGIATFLAIVGIALTGGDNQAEAGFGCGGRAANNCGGRVGLLARLHARGCGGAAVEACCPAPAPAPACCEPACPPDCSGGLFAKLRAKHAARKAARKCCKPDPCCAPAPEPCCAPAPAPAPCCAPAPAPEPCCAPAPAPCCAPAAAPVAAPCCGAAPMMSEGVVYEGVPTDASPMVNDAGEEIVPGSVQVTDDGAGAISEAVPSAPEAADGI